MQLFKPKYTVCSVCGVHFEPVSGYEVRWGNLCAIHRVSVKQQDERKDAVISWATANWVRLEKMMKEEYDKNKEQYKQLSQIDISQLAADQCRQSNPYPGMNQNMNRNTGLGTLFDWVNFRL